MEVPHGYKVVEALVVGVFLKIRVDIFEGVG